ncbi:MAG: NfeD family protein [Endomicrobia bacterium]|nr:NfeD family protein [Endomicrobiia bacterium]
MINPITWLIVAIIFFIIELLTPGIFLFSCFTIGALVAMVVSLVTKSLLIQCLVFAICSILSIYFLKPLLMKLLTPLTIKTNVDSIIGKKGIVIEKINGCRSMGIVKVDNELWRAVTNGDIVIDVNEEVIIAKVEGAHLVVAKAKDLNNSKFS